MIALQVIESDGTTQGANDKELGVLFDDELQIFLPFAFKNLKEAQRFLEAAERTGINLWGGMPNSDLKPLVALWRDADKRNG